MHSYYVFIPKLKEIVLNKASLKGVTKYLSFQEISSTRNLRVSSSFARQNCFMFRDVYEICETMK